MYRAAADAVLIAHASFVLFATLGGFLLLRWQRLIWLHVPAVVWGATVEFSGWICPLTPLENHLHVMAGDPAYSGDFITHYISALLYPVGLTRATQIVLGVIVLAINALAYALLLWHARPRSSALAEQQAAHSSNAVRTANRRAS